MDKIFFFVLFIYKYKILTEKRKPENIRKALIKKTLNNINEYKIKKLKRTFKKNEFI